jgi:aspartyl-tRNA(Asn)/glutamyl-tRNA(Gln) amidotransferase subunit C
MSDFDIERVEALAKLTLSTEEREALTKDLPDILAYVSKLQEVDTSKVETSAYVTDAVNVMRDDEVHAVSEEDRQRLINEFPQKMGDALQVPHVFE